MSWELIVALIGILVGGGGISALLLYRAQNQRMNAETQKLKLETNQLAGSGGLANAKDVADTIKHLLDQVTERTQELLALNTRMIELENEKRIAEERCAEEKRRLGARIMELEKELKDLQRAAEDLKRNLT